MISAIAKFLWNCIKRRTCLLPKALPFSDDIPLAPLGIESSPGGALLPRLVGTARETAPQISHISDMTYADETLCITGHDLQEAEIEVWGEGRLERIVPLKTSVDRIQAILPGDFPLSTTLIWPVRTRTVVYYRGPPFFRERESMALPFASTPQPLGGSGRHGCEQIPRARLFGSREKT